ncbi:MAG TPA: hypothetical protein VHS74_03065 [Solirubrobacterales bacterium]|jgi:hypothetical protein|nr:hypothetical protein [Solirubrobacterales bacterium]
MVVALWLFGASVSAASAAGPEFLTQFGSVGAGPGQFKSAVTVATDSQGHVFIDDSETHRIDEFTAWGAFLKALGWDVAPGAVNELQEVRVRAAAGQFRLHFGGSETTDLPFDASTEEVQAALNSLAAINSGGGSVAIKGTPAGAIAGSPGLYFVAFNGGPRRGENVEALAVGNGTVPLSGGSPSSGATVTTIADGTHGGSGLESCTAESGCQAGSAGAGAGQFQQGGGIAIDDAGDIYVFDWLNRSLQKFDPAGRFLYVVGGEVNRTTGENRCTQSQLEGGNVCGIGVSGTGPGEFSIGGAVGIESDYVALSPGGQVYVGDKNRIQEFKPDGSFKAEIPLPEPGNPGALAVDPLGGDLYFAFGQEGSTKHPEIFKLSPGGTLLGKLGIAAPRSVATDGAGSVYGVREILGQPGERDEVVLFDASGKETSRCCQAELRPDAGGEESFFHLEGVDTNGVGDLYVVSNAGSAGEYVRVYGPGPASLEPPPLVAPEIDAQFASSVATESATLQAKINPQFWSDTKYFVEYGTGKCSEGGCAGKQPLPPGQALTSKVIQTEVSTTGITLPGLAPGTTYHYRFVAQSTGSGDQPVRGVGGKVGEDGSEGSFTTFPAPTVPDTSCANQAFRVGAGAALPDCRAYEMVSPTDKNGGEILALPDINATPNTLVQAAADANSLTYSSFGSFADPNSAPFTAQYLATRGPNGWRSTSLSPPRGQSFYSADTSLQNEVKAFSADLTSSWLRHDSGPQLSAGVVAGYATLYRRDNLTNSYEALCSVKPPHQLPREFKPEIQGVSANGSHLVFSAADNLSPEAPASAGVEQVYDCSGGVLKLVSILPNGTASTSSSTVGTGGILNSPSVINAVSADGSHVFWSTEGKIYVRIDGTSTTAVSTPESTQPAQFWTAATDGSKAIFSIISGSKAGNLYLFNVAAKATTLIAQESLGVFGASDDASFVYFVSRKVLAGGAVGGKPNIYLFHEGAYTYIGALSEADLKVLSPVSPAPFRHTSRVSPDGRHLAFTSAASLTGFDNLDAKSGEPDTEVFLYDAEANRLTCASCNRTGARPSGGEVAAPQNAGDLAVAAMIPAGQTPFHSATALSNDGRRLFFNSFDSLTPADTNGVADVYEWEEQGTGDCSTASSAYSPSNGGCVSLISSGTSPSDSTLLDASATGDDIFFSTSASLVNQDPGHIDIYDARVAGGFPEPPPAPPICEGEACQSPGPPPAPLNPASSLFQGSGNVKEKSKSGCAKGKHQVKKKGKRRCVKNAKKKPASKKKTKSATHKHRRAGR